MDPLYKKCSKNIFFTKMPCAVKRSAMGCAMGISPSKGVLWGRAMAAVQRSIDRTPSPRYGSPTGGRVAGACHACLL